MFVSLIVLHVLVAVSLVLIVLLQTGRGAELGAAFGGMGQATYGRGQYTFIHKVTTALAVVFMITSLTLAFIEVEQPRTSVLSPADSTATATPAAAQPAAATPPAQDAAPPQAPAAQPPETPTLPQQDAPPATGAAPAKQ